MRIDDWRTTDAPIVLRGSGHAAGGTCTCNPEKLVDLALRLTRKYARSTNALSDADFAHARDLLRADDLRGHALAEEWAIALIVIALKCAVADGFAGSESALKDALILQRELSVAHDQLFAQLTIASLQLHSDAEGRMFKDIANRVTKL